MAPADRPQRARAERGPAHEPRQRHRASVVRDERTRSRTRCSPRSSCSPAATRTRSACYVLPKRLDEKVARLHLDALGVRAHRAHPRAGGVHRRAGRGPVQGRPLPLLTSTDAAGGGSGASALGEPAGLASSTGRERLEARGPRGASAVRSRSRRSATTPARNRLGRGIRERRDERRDLARRAMPRRGTRLSAHEVVGVREERGDAPRERVGEPRDVGASPPSRRARAEPRTRSTAARGTRSTWAWVPASRSPSRCDDGLKEADEHGESAEREVDLEDADEGADEGVAEADRAAVVAHDAQPEGELAERAARGRVSTAVGQHHDDGDRGPRR